MLRRSLWLSLSILMGLLSAALVLAVPAQAAKLQQAGGNTNLMPSSGAEIVGVVNDFPSSLLGRWTVDQVVYTATRETRFMMLRGPFYTGGCVKVRFDAGSHTALSIETQSQTACGSKTVKQLIGLVEQAPAGFAPEIASGSHMTATWVISGTSIVSTPYTRFDLRNGPLVVGACAEAKYTVVNGQNQAIEISSEKMYRCLGPVAFNQAYGFLVTYPPDLSGAWVISNTTGVSLTFMSTATTTVFAKGGSLQPGACVGVKYYTSGGVNYAALVVVGDSHLCKGKFGSGQPASKIIATLDARPEGTITGTWTLAGVPFSATAQTRVEHAQSLVVGSCTAAKYDPANGDMLLQQVEGEESHDCQAEDGSPRFKLFGVIEVIPTSTLSGTWQVSGVTFETTPTTTIESRHGEFAIGAYVKVDFTYDPATGKRTALVIKTHVAPGFGWINFHGRFGGWVHDRNGQHVIVNGKTYDADPDMVASTNIQIGDQVSVNAYVDNGATLVTQVSAGGPVYLPLMRR